MQMQLFHLLNSPSECDTRLAASHNYAMNVKKKGNMTTRSLVLLMLIKQWVAGGSRSLKVLNYRLSFPAYFNLCVTQQQVDQTH